MAEEIGSLAVKISLDSGGFQNGVSAVNRQIKVLDSEFKANTASLGENARGLEGLKIKSESLAKSLELQKQKVAALEGAYQKSVESKGKDAKATQDLEIKLNGARTALSKTETSLKSTNKEIDVQASKWTELGKKVEAAGNKLSTIGKGMTSAGKTLSMGLTVPILAAGAAAVKLASDQNESLNKVDVAFKNNSNEVKSWSDTTLAKFGIAKGSSLEMASLFGDMGTSMGLSTGEAANMSTSLGGLAGDLASFKNIGIDQAQDALKGIFTGEGESLKTLGVVMQDSTLSAYAAANGYKKTYTEMTQAEKVGLRYAFVMNATKNAQGDFARTSDGTANSSRIFSESIKELGANFGTYLLPVITPIIQKLSSLAQSFGKLSPETKKTIMIIAGIAAVIGPLLIVVGSVITAVGAIAGAFGAASVAIGAAGGMIAIITGPIGITIAAIAILVGIGIVLYKNWDTIKATASQVWEGIKNTVGNAMNGIVGFFTGLPAAASTAWTNTIAGAAQFIQGLQTAFVTGVKNIVTGFINGFNGIIAGLAGIWAGVQAAVGAAINGIMVFLQTKFGAQIVLFQVIFERIGIIFKEAWNIIKNIVLGAVLLILDLVTGNFTKLQTDAWNIWNQISTSFTLIWLNIKAIFSEALQIITITMTNAWNNISSFVINTWNALVATLQGAFNSFVSFMTTTWANITTNTTNAWNNLKTAVSNIVTNTITAIKGFFTGLVTFFQTLPATLQTLGTNMFTSMKNGATTAITGLVSAVKTGIGQAITWITSLPNQAVTWGSDIIQGIVTGIQNAAGAVGKAVEGVAQDIRNFLHFSVPDKGPLSDFDTYMPDMIDLMVGGINGNKSKLFDTVKGLASGMSIGIKDTARTFSATGVSWNGKSGTLDSPNNSGTGASANGGGLVVQIENFNNARSQDVQAFAEELEFYRKQKSMGLGVV